MKKIAVPVVAALAVAVVVFLAGIGVGAAGAFGVRVPVSVGAGTVGDHVASLWARGDDATAYGAKASVLWRDAQGSEHEDGWPDCLSTPGQVEGVRFIGAMVWHGDNASGTILWVDCQGR
jgi:hypothetical protein